MDRPLTPDELRTLSSHKLVEIGNHTADHAILLNYSKEEASKQIADAQSWLQQTTGKRPVAIAYPNGGVNDVVEAAARDAGLKIGFTTRPHKNVTGERLAGSNLMPPNELLRVTTGVGGGAVTIIESEHPERVFDGCVS